MDLQTEVEKLQGDIAGLTKQLATAAGVKAAEIAGQLSAQREILAVRQAQLSAQRDSEAAQRASEAAQRAQDEVEAYQAQTAQIEADWRKLHEQAEAGIASFLAAAGKMRELSANWQQQQARDGKGSRMMDRGLPGPRFQVSANVRHWTKQIGNGQGRL